MKKTNLTYSKSSIFKPIIASSLALTLVSSALCAEEGILISGGSTPELSIDKGTGNINSQENTWTSNGNSATWAEDNGIYSISVKNSEATNAKTPISGEAKNLAIAFNKNNNTNQLIVWQQGDQQENVFEIAASNQATNLSLDFQGKGLKLDGNLGLNLNFGTGEQISTNKKITISNLSSLEGKLTIYGGGGQNVFNVKIGEMKGDIIFSTGNIHNSSTGGKNSTITISKNLIGNISTAGTMGKDSDQIPDDGVSIVFTQGATMTGDVRGYGVGYDGLKRMITFEGGFNKTVITGSVFSYGTNATNGISFDSNAGNHLQLKAGDMQGSVVATVGNGMGAKKGFNTLTFSSASTQTMTGGILADDTAVNNSGQGQATNILTLKEGTTLKIVADSSKNTVTDKGSACVVPTDSSACSSTQKAQSGYGTVDKTFTLTTGSIIARGYGINEINLDANTTLILDNGNGKIKTESTSGGSAKSRIQFNGVNGTIQGNIITTTGETTITVFENASGVITGSVTTSDSNDNALTARGIGTAAISSSTGQNAIHLGIPNHTPYSVNTTTASLTLQGATNTIAALIATAQNSTLNIDGSRNANITTISSITGDTNLTLNLNGRGEGNSATAKLINGGNSLTLKALALGSGSTHNTLDLTERNAITTITDQISVGSGQGVTIKLKGQELALIGGMLTSGGTSTLNISAAESANSAILSGGDITLTNLDLIAGTSANQNAQLTLKNSDTMITKITANKTDNGSSPQLILDANSAGKSVIASTSSIEGEGLILELKGGDSDKSSTFNINGGINKIKELKFTGNNNQTFNANTGDTTIQTFTLTSTSGNTINTNGGNTTIISAITLTDNKALALGIGNGDLTLSGNLTAGNGTTGTANINFTGNGTLKSNLTIGATNQGAININVSSGDGRITGILNNRGNTNTNQGININFKGSNASLSIANSTAFTYQNGTPISHTISTLTAEGSGNILNLSGQTRNSGTLPARSNFQTLKINNLKADSQSINFIVYADPEANNGQKPRADRIIIESSTNGSGTENKTHYLGVIGDPHKIIGKDLYTEGGENNIALATVKDNSITLEAVNNISGFSLITYEYQTASTQEDGTISKAKSNDYTTYFLGSAKSLGATEASQEVSASALATNYDLYLANMNSLNKRMGELRNNPHSQGVWTRVFNGMQTTNFALQTQAIYTTIQAGYDYAFGSEGANNYVGVALSYANSSTKSRTINELNQTTQTTTTKGIDAVTSNAVEIAVYNSYVQDGASAQSGWNNGLFSDSILKFSYISSDLTLLDQTNTYNTTNYALTLSQEVGYRFLLGESQEWNIDPQAEVALGYLNQSNLKQTLGTQNYLDGIQNAIVTLRSRFGALFGYDFKNFTQSKDISAKLYIGTYYAYDYIAGGDVSLTDNFGTKVSLSPLGSTGRFELNLGTNIEIKDNTRIYFDFERSFGGDITTEYQVNLGVRYSFGESKSYTPVDTQAIGLKRAPLKVKEAQENTQEQTQTSKKEENIEIKQESKEAQ